MLAGSSLGNNTRLSDPLSQKSLSNSVVDLVGTGMRQILPLQPNCGTSAHLCQTLRLVQRRRPSNKIATVYIKLCQEIWIVLNLCICFLDLSESLRQCLGYVLSPEFSEPFANTQLGNLICDSIVWNAPQTSCLVRGSLALFASRGQLRNNFLHRRHALLSRITCLLHSPENGTSDDNTVSDLRHALNHLGIGDTEPDSERKVRLESDSLDEVVEIQGQLAACSGDSGGGHAVDESGGSFGEVTDALICGRRSNERNVGQTVLIACLGQVGSFLGRQIHDDESVGSVFLGLLAHGLDSVLEEWVVISHEDDGNCEALRAGGLHHFQALNDVRSSGLNGDLIGLLDGGSVGLGIGVGNAELDDGGSSFLHGEKDGRCIFLHGKPCSDKGNKRRLSPTFSCCKRFLYPSSVSSWHGRYVRHLDADTLNVVII
mmetsp:Transcript_10558/g.22064  ORF Transcript_10558/g.22064 Transcript_10558/m.22064 type:complete len:430 (-) Transcript_10558:404-1693(-)